MSLAAASAVAVPPDRVRPKRCGDLGSIAGSENGEPSRTWRYSGGTARELPAFADDRRNAHKKTKASDSTLRRLAKHLVPEGSRSRALGNQVTDLVRPVARARARRIAADHAASGEDLRLHIGSGGEHKDGWVNIDLAGDPIEVPWNLKHPLPFPDGSADAMFSEHLLEHIPLPGVVNVLRECHRVLKPGGIMRVGVPDAGRMLESYTEEGKGFIETTRPDRPQVMLAVQELFYWYEHVTMYDERTLAWLLTATGFTSEIHRRDPGRSALPVEAPDTPAAGPRPSTSRR